MTMMVEKMVMKVIIIMGELFSTFPASSKY